jgi:hypothetical protein
MQVEDEGWMLQPLGEPAPCGWVGRYTFPDMEYVFEMLKMLIQDKNSRHSSNCLQRSENA